MPINPDLLVAAPMLQNYIVDKDTGFPLANGIVTLWVDTARFVQYKNWYYQTGSPGAYTYIPLANPLRLSSVGTIQDPNGNDVIPFYYPYEENNENVKQAYFITVYSADENGNQAVLQFTRENFPFQPSNSSPTSQNPTFRNYIKNNVYWRNIGTLDCTNVLDQVIAPSQHEGYTNGDIRFRKNITGSTDTLSFLPMTQVLQDDITPEFYMNFNCTSPQAGETLKCIQYPISMHVKTLQNVLASFVIHAQNVAGNPNNYIDLYIYQFLGTGALLQPPPVLIERIVLGNSFQKYISQIILPDANGLTLGAGGDDALFLLVQFPLSLSFNLNHTKPQIYLGDQVSDNDFDTYDEINSIISTPRTGDVRTTINNYEFGYVKMDDGTIGSASSLATNRRNTDTWPLYNLIWNSVNRLWAPVVGGAGADSISDFEANKPIYLTRALGRVFAGTLNTEVSQSFTADFTTATLTIASTANMVSGVPVEVGTSGTLPSGLSTGTTYYAYISGPTTLRLMTNTQDAINNVNPVNLIDNGTPPNFLIFPPYSVGEFVGEEIHTLNIAEMPSHNHPGSTITGDPNDTGNGQMEAQGINSTSYTILNIAAQGGGQPHNTMQPTTYMNVFIKL